MVTTTSVLAGPVGGNGAQPPFRRARPCVVIAVVCAALGVRGAWGRSGQLVRARALLRRGNPGPDRGGAAVRAWAGRMRVCAAAVGPAVWCLPVGGALGWLEASPLPVVAGALAVPLVRRRLRARGRGRERECREAAVIAFCDALAADVRAGRQPDVALQDVDVEGLPGGGAVRAAVRLGGDVVAELRVAARAPGGEGLAAVAACWQVATEDGAGLAAGLGRIASTLRAARDQRAELAAQAAGPRATAQTLAALPVCGLLMGAALGVDPLGVLLHTPLGWGCLAVGGALEWAGVVWSAHIVRAAGAPV